MANHHNQHGSECYKCCGACRLFSDNFWRGSGAALGVMWGNPELWTIDNRQLLSPNYSPTLGIAFNGLTPGANNVPVYDFDSVSWCFDMLCETTDGALSVGFFPTSETFANVGFIFQFGTNSSVTFGGLDTDVTNPTHIYDIGGAVPFTLTENTTYEVRIKVSDQGTPQHEYHVFIDGVAVGRFQSGFNALDNPRLVFFNEKIDPVLTNTSGGYQVDNRVHNSETPAASVIRIDNFWVSFLDNGDADRSHCEAENSFPIGNTDLGPLDITFAGASVSAVNGTYTTGSYGAPSGDWGGSWSANVNIVLPFPSPLPFPPPVQVNFNELEVNLFGRTLTVELRDTTDNLKATWMKNVLPASASWDLPQTIADGDWDVVFWNGQFHYPYSDNFGTGMTIKVESV